MNTSGSLDDEIDAKLARISRRLQTARDEVRSRLETVPDLLDLAEHCRERFQARLVYVRVGTWETGNRAAFDARGVPPSPPDPRAMIRLRKRRP